MRKSFQDINDNEFVGSRLVTKLINHPIISHPRLLNCDEKRQINKCFFNAWRELVLQGESKKTSEESLNEKPESAVVGQHNLC